MCGQLDQCIRQQGQRPAGAARRRARAGGRHQQSFLLAGQLALCAGTRLLAQRPLQIAFDKTPLGPVNRGTADPDAGSDVLIADTRVGGQQDLCPLELPRRVLASAQKRQEFVAFVLGQLDTIAYIHRSLLVGDPDESTDESNVWHGRRPSFTPKQGQYLAFIDAYTRVHRRPPAEAEIQRHFGVTPPSVHQMILTLERAGFIRRQPGVPRSIELLIPPEELPVLLKRFPSDLNRGDSREDKDGRVFVH